MRKLLSTLCLAFLAGTTSVAALAVESVQKDAATQSAAVAGKVNLNSADADTLARELVGIGASKAQAIVAHREAHGPFATVDELLEVKGIGTAILEKNLNRLSVQ
ncbi:MAG TPA: ComEA family DNA-binding protein [Pseudomonas sp.]|jgi:competence protein ComEA|nr:ComEA family DNA-binding protein [Pseudomonas sp.]